MKKVHFLFVIGSIFDTSIAVKATNNDNIRNPSQNERVTIQNLVSSRIVLSSCLMCEFVLKCCKLAKSLYAIQFICVGLKLLRVKLCGSKKCWDTNIWWSKICWGGYRKDQIGEHNFGPNAGLRIKFLKFRSHQILIFGLFSGLEYVQICRFQAL